MDYQDPTPIDCIYPIILQDTYTRIPDTVTDFGKKVNFLKHHPEPKLSTRDFCYYNDKLVHIMQICIHRTPQKIGYCYKIMYDDNTYKPNPKQTLLNSKNKGSKYNSRYDYAFESDLYDINVIKEQPTKKHKECYSYEFMNCLIC